MKILLPDINTLSNNDLNLDKFSDFGEVFMYNNTNEEQLVERIGEVDAILCNKTALNRNTLKNAKNLKYIGLFSTGYNNIDIEYAKENNITVSNAGAYSTKAVAQHTFALMLNHFSRIKDYSNFVADGKWADYNSFCPLVYNTEEVAGKTIGIIGYGSIGMEVAKIAKAFSMNVLAYSRNQKHDENVSIVSMDEVIKNSDIITIHCPLNKDSLKMCDKAFFEKCKRGAYFINTARGAIMDEQALYDALESEKLSGAGIDVLEQEPIKKDCILVNARNITITPHIAWSPIQTRKRVLEIAYKNLANFVAGNPTNVVS